MSNRTGGRKLFGLLCFALALLPLAACQAAVKNVSVDYSSTNGSIDIIIGLDRNPNRWLGGPGTVVDMGPKLHDIGAMTLRTHGVDEDHSHPTNLEGIFPDWRSEWWTGNNDPFLDTANYNFDNSKFSYSIPGANNYVYAHSTDGKIDDIVQKGFAPLFRLGYRTPDSKWQRFSYLGYTYMPNPIPDTDTAREKVAIVCESILKHYNENWFSGRQYGIQFWEVWNEPDLKGMWGNDLTSYDYVTLSVQFQKLYAAIATKYRGTRTNPIRPEIKIGPCAIAWTEYPTGYHKDKSQQFCEVLLGYCNSHNVPVDFYSWHEYGGMQAATAPGVTTIWYVGNAWTYLNAAKRIRTALASNGYPNALSIIDEWNSLCNQDNPYHDSCLAAAFTANVMMYLDYAGVYMSNYFPQANTWGIFDEYGNYTKEAYAFKTFSTLRTLTPRRLNVTSGLVMDVNAATADNFAIMGGKSDDGNTIQVLLADENQKYIKAPGYNDWLRSNGSYWLSNAILDPARQTYDSLSLTIQNLPANHLASVTYRTIDANGTWVESPVQTYHTTDTVRDITLQRPWAPPAVCLAQIQLTAPSSICEARCTPDAGRVYVTGGTVSAAFANRFYLEQPDRTSGIMVTWPNPVTEGAQLNVLGTTSISDGEHSITATSVESP